MSNVFDPAAAKRRLDVFRKIDAERLRQEQLCQEGRFKYTCATTHGLTPADKAVVLTEEVGEVCGAALQSAKLTTDRTAADLRKEVLHVAAVAVAWLESFEATDESNRRNGY